MLQVWNQLLKKSRFFSSFKVIISAATREQSGIWVGLLVTSSEDLPQSIQETFDWVSSAVKIYLGYLPFIIYQK